MPATIGSKKDSDRAVTSGAEAVCVPAHLVPPGPLQAKQLCHLHTQLSLGQSCHRQKKSCAYAGRVNPVVSHFATLWTVACQAALTGRRVLQARMLERTGQYWLPYPSRALYFLLPWPPTPLSTWCCQNPCDPSSCNHLCTWPSLGQTQVLQGSLRSRPQWTTHIQRWK